MEISEIKNKEEFSAIIVNELKDIGVKYRKEKKSKIIQDKSYRKRIFRTHLHLLELTDVILANGSVVQIPKFVADACNRILEQVETEGIFRKAGSSIRQKEIRISLEAGVPLGKSHHVIDVANVVKFFFRELPEPLIPPSMQETLLRSLLIGENHVKAILLTCLLLPPLTINTLSFFMQFLYTVSLSEYANKMSIENLAIIFTPGLMPFPNINSHRFTNHLKMVRLLIENANAIGTIPNNIANKLQRKSQLLDSTTMDLVMSISSSDGLEDKTAKKKKKRRSGSLTQMFNGLRKIVGSAVGSSEHLANTPSETKEVGNSSSAICDDHEENLGECVVVGRSVVATPCLKANKKRKFADPVCAFSTKKKEPKKSRMSLGGRHIKNIALNPVVTSMERRWSIVGSGWSKNKNKQTVEHKTLFQSNDCLFDVESTEVQDQDGGVNDKAADVLLLQNSVPIDGNISFDDANQLSVRCEKNFDDSISCGVTDEDDCGKISKNEYEEIKERVAAIESRISHEFGTIRNSMQRQSPISVTSAESSSILSGPERVQTQYERMVVETESLSSPATEKLAQRLSRGLKIRRSIDQRVIRSPSARKIGTMRRRSQDKMRLSRNPTLHLTVEEDTANHLLPNSFYAKGNLRRGKPNTLQTGLLPLSQQQHNSHIEVDYYSKNEPPNEQWMSGEEFFIDFVSKSPLNKVDEVSINNTHVDHVKTPVSRNIRFDEVKTPMLPPKSLPRKAVTVRTPSNTTIKPSTTSKLPFVNRIAISTPIDEEVSGRASIARLRTQNAGMVMAKAKLFDGLGAVSSSEHRPARTDRSQLSSKSIHVVSSSLRCPVTPDLACLENSFASIKTNSIMSAVTTPKTTCKITPIAKRIHSTSVNSPSSSKRRQRSVAVKYSQKQMLQSIITDEKLITTRNFNERSLNRVNATVQSSRQNESSTVISSPRTSKTTHSHYRNPNSPRIIKKHHQHSKFRTAMSSPSANRSKRATQHRNSPRNIASKGSKPIAL